MLVLTLLRAFFWLIDLVADYMPCHLSIFSVMLHGSLVVALELCWLIVFLLFLEKMDHSVESNTVEDFDDRSFKKAKCSKLDLLA
jgi:hypothetical protein